MEEFVSQAGGAGRGPPEIAASSDGADEPSSSAADGVSARRRRVPGRSQRLRRAMAQIPAQADRWSCGPNAAARALVLVGRSLPSYPDFVRDCPQSFGPQTPPEAHLLARWAATRTLVRNVLPAVGPHPRLLADYIDRASPRVRARHLASHDANAFTEQVAAALRAGRPSLLLACAHPFALHYLVAVQYRPHSDGWRLLDGPRMVELSGPQLRQRCDALWCLWGWWVGLGRFNAIAISRRQRPAEGH